LVYLDNMQPLYEENPRSYFLKQIYSKHLLYHTGKLSSMSYNINGTNVLIFKSYM
jgi:hypothetical protein